MPNSKNIFYQASRLDRLAITLYYVKHLKRVIEHDSVAITRNIRQIGYIQGNRHD